MKAYHAIIEPFGGTAVSGTALVVVDDDVGLFYGGSITGLEANMDPVYCPAKNGCGVHVHSGKSCRDLLAQEGHYYDVDDLDSDPWANAQYSSDGGGRAVFGGFADIGPKSAGDLVGRAFLVHAEDGGRVGCGLLRETASGVMKASMAGFERDGAGEAYAFDAGDDAICFVGSASVLSASAIPPCDPAGTPNSCGVHVHSGTACDSKEAQGGHWYIAADDPTAEDPWGLVGYPAVYAGGVVRFGDCVATGFPASDALARPFIVHDLDGIRALCGVLEGYDEEAGGGWSPGATAGLISASLAAVLCLALAWCKCGNGGGRPTVAKYPSDLNFREGNEYTDEDQDVQKNEEWPGRDESE